MKKNFISAITAFSALIMLSSCISIPEPSEKTKTLVYGITEFSYHDKNLSNLIPSSDDTETDMTLVILNEETKKDYSLTTNTKGELKAFRIPSGSYRLVSLKKIIKGYTAELPCTYIFSDADKNYRFRIEDNTVTNLGKFKYDILNYLSQRTETCDCGFGYEEAKTFFHQRYPESAWNSAEWK